MAKTLIFRLTPFILRYHRNESHYYPVNIDMHRAGLGVTRRKTKKKKEHTVSVHTGQFFSPVRIAGVDQDD